MSGDCVLGLDCGTQSAKAGVWTLEGEPVSRGSSPLQVTSPHPGWAEQDPRRWWTAACAAIREACAGVDSSRIAALGVAWQRESFTLVGKDGEPLRAGILWLDIRASAEAAARAGEAETLHAETGKPLDVTTTLPRLDWLRAHEPGLFRASPRWVDVGCWLLERLVGRRATCVAGADTTGMIALEGRAWSGAVLSRAGLRPEDMPELLEPASVAGPLARAAAADTGLPPGIPVVAAGGDGQVFATGLGAAGAGSVMTLTLGTSVVLGVPARGPSVSPRYRTLFAARTDRSYLLEAVVQSGTYLFRWLEDAFRGRAPGAGSDLATREQAAAAIPPGSEGLVTVPHWWGTRFPSPHPEARGITLGWSHRHGLAHLHRSLLEGVAFELKHCAAAIAESLPGGLPPRVAAGGGGASSRLWLTIIADVLGCELRVPQDPEPVALAAALLAGTGAGLVAGIEEATRRFVRPGGTLIPDPGRAAFYDRLYREVYVPLREAGIEMSARLAALA